MDDCSGPPRPGTAVSLPVLPAQGVPSHRASFGTRRGKIRALVLAGVWLFMLLHVVQWLAVGSTLAPIEPSESMATVKDGVVTVGAIFFATALVSTALLGRWFCGWGCHWVAIQDATAWFLARHGLRPKPFRSRLLVWMPLALALYMFAWPPFYRLVIAPWTMPDLRWPGFSMHVTTADFWATFPGLAMGIPFVLVSGVLVVWLLGTKGYCTYACPYGGFFAPADELAPMRIKVDHDRCHQCGRCTAACTSNVRVHEEIRDFGAVVDSGCMKCMDCVTACPNEALSFGLARPAVRIDRAGSRSAASAERRWDLSWPEEIALAAVMLATLLAVRGISMSVPLLFASGIAACTTFIAWKSVRVLRDASVSFHGARLRFRGRLTGTGVAWLAAASACLCGVAYVGVLNGTIWLADRADARVTIPAEAIFLADGTEPDPAMRADAERALALYALASAPPDGWSVLPFGRRQIDLRRAYLLCALRRFDDAERLLQRTWERDGPDEAVAAVIGRALRTQPSRRDDALAWYDAVLLAHPAWQRLREEQVTWLDNEGEFVRMVQSARQGLDAVPEDLLAMRRLSIALTERGQSPAEIEEGVALIRRTLEIAPNNGFAHAALARGLARLGRMDEAAAEFRRALELEPASEMIRGMAEEFEGQRGSVPAAPVPQQ
jgi:polyferredoxin